MATLRKRWFKVHDSILREPWSREEKLAQVLLAAYLNTRWARDGVPDDQAGRAVLSPGTMRDIGGRQYRNVLPTVLERLSGSITFEGGYGTVYWPNFPSEQEYGSRHRASDRPRIVPSDEPPPSPTPSPSSSKTRRSIPPLIAAATPRIEKAKRTGAPDRLPDTDRAALRAWAGTKHPRQLDRLVALEEACLGFHRGKGNLAADWYATVQTWVRNEDEGRFSSSARQAAPPAPQFRSYWPTKEDFEPVEVPPRKKKPQ